VAVSEKREVGFAVVPWPVEVGSRMVGFVVQEVNDMLGLEWKGYGADPGNLCKVGRV